MISLDKLEYWAKKKERSNLKFRSYLKNHADAEVLDEQFAKLHEKYFSQIDCSKCRNCCKEMNATIPKEDLLKVANHLGITTVELIDKYLILNNGEYCAKNYPCDFLGEDNNCILGDCRPDTCKDFPHTNKPERLWRLYGVIDSAKHCPVVYEILEELKEAYYDNDGKLIEFNGKEENS